MIDRLSVVIPAYNEQAGVRKSVEGIQSLLRELELDHEILVIDDGSTDGTPEILASIEGIHLVRNPTNLGYGASLKVGVGRAIHDHVFTIDADESYPTRSVEDLISTMDGYDLNIGARKLRDVDNPLHWNLSKAAIQTFLSLLLGQRIVDLNSGARLFRRELAVSLSPILSDRFSYSSGMTVAALRAGRRVRFTPIDYRPRTGTSKVRPASYTSSFIRSILKAYLHGPTALTNKIRRQGLGRWRA